MLSLTLYSRTDCCLCDDMKKVLATVRRDVVFQLGEINVSNDPILESRYGFDVPVLLVNGRRAFKYRLTERALRRTLSRASRLPDGA